MREWSRSPVVLFSVALLAGCGGTTSGLLASAGEDGGGGKAGVDAGAAGDAGATGTGGGGGGGTGDDAGTPITSREAGVTGDASALTTLPLGDGKYQAYPQQGYIYSCQQNITGGGGAMVDGPWIHADAGTFDFLAKAVVQGAVAWPSHTFAAAALSGTTRTVTGNDLPDHTTGTFPIASTDPAYAYDRNPNSIAAQTLSWSLPSTPTVATTPSCLDGGPIGVLLTGAMLYDALDGEGRDALAHETQDACQAHPQQQSEYHYHSVTTCIADPGTGHSALLGYARDGFGIYGVRGESGETLTNADLDECHGHTHTITWDGASVSLYHYHATYEYPYTMGCYRGTPAAQ